jgi:glycosyltransferase involved in cell wall biosynthesis
LSGKSNRCWSHRLHTVAIEQLLLDLMLATNSAAPKVSIGLPVYNDDRFLAQTLDCLLSQSYRDFELIICDNASTDKTAEISRSYASRDSRIRYHRNPTNLGVSRNFNLSFHLSRGKYFKWAAANDLCATDMIERCVEVLDQRPDAVLCFAKTRIIDERGEVGADFDDRLDLQSDRPSERFRMLLEGISMVNVAYGVSRSSALRLTRLEQPYSNSDVAFLAELALHGKFVEVPDTSFFRRMFEISTEKYPSPHDRMKIYEPEKADKLSFPYWWLFGDFLAAICRAPISTSERLRCLFYMHIWMQRWGRGLLQDLMVAAKRLMSWISIKRVIGSGFGRD